MGDVMLLGVLRMPRDLREMDEISRRQFDRRVLAAADELERRADELAQLLERHERALKQCKYIETISKGLPILEPARDASRMLVAILEGTDK